eukprot:COSAG05_NODE_3633_length_1945_cov_0.862947_4_plen_115_part_00
MLWRCDPHTHVTRALHVLARCCRPGSEGKEKWQSKVEVPGAMLVSTISELSEWGQSMGFALVSCTVFSLGLFPFAVAMGHNTLVLGARDRGLSDLPSLSLPLSLCLCVSSGPGF